MEKMRHWAHAFILNNLHLYFLLPPFFFVPRRFHHQCPVVSSALKYSHLCCQQFFSLTVFGCLVLSCILSVVYISGAWSSFVSFLVSVSHWRLFALLLLRPCLTEVFWNFFFFFNKWLSIFQTQRFACLHYLQQKKKGIESLMSSLAKFRGTKDEPLCQKNKEQSWNTWEWPLRGWNFLSYLIK